MLNPRQFHDLVIVPTLAYLDLDSPAARRLLLGTALAESNLTYLKQLGLGPALGVYQVEPATHRDLDEHFYPRHPSLAARVRQLAAPTSRDDFYVAHEQLVTNLAYATAVARVVYYRRPEPLPAANDAAGLARYHEVHYNTRLGAVGRTPQLEHLPLFERVVREY